MTRFLTLSPFAAYATLIVIAPAMVALFTGAVLAVLIVCADLWRGRSPKILQSGAATLFAALGCYIVVVDPQFGGSAARTAVDAGLLAIVLTSLAARAPFTLQYARENVDAQTATRIEFLRANYFLTWVWTAALVAMLAADLCAIYVPSLPLWIGLVVAFVARNGAMAFTHWYSQRRRAARTAAQQEGKVA